MDFLLPLLLVATCLSAQGRLVVMSQNNLRIFRESVLKAHNYYRSQHKNTAPLVMDDQLNIDAQEWAEKQCTNKEKDKGCCGGEHSFSSASSRYSENLAGAMSGGGGYPGDADTIENWAGPVVFDWWAEIKDWTGTFQWGPVTSHFTAIVWQTTTKAGFGHCVWDDGRGNYYTKIVSRMTPAGNILDPVDRGNWERVQPLKSGRSWSEVSVIKFDKDGNVIGSPRFLDTAALGGGGGRGAASSNRQRKPQRTAMKKLPSPPIPAAYYGGYRSRDGNCAGNMISEMNGSLAYCEQTCSMLSNCRGFSYHKRREHCLLKSATCDHAKRNAPYTFYEKEF